MKSRLITLIFLALWMVGLVPVDALGGPSSKTARQPQELKALLEAFDLYAETARKSWQIPGMAVAIVVDDKMVFAKGYGVKREGGNDPVDAHTIFQIGSTSKAFTSALTAIMVDQGRLKWTDRVVDHVRDFAMHDPWVTREFRVHDLMAQHSGLVPYAGDLQSMMGFDRRHIVRSLRYLRPVSGFRADYGYMNNLFLVSAAVTEKLTGRSWEADIQARMFEPLGMKESTVGLKAFKDAANLAIPHVRKDDKLIPLNRDWPYHQWVYTYGPAGGINSSVTDMANWIRLQLNKGTFEGKTLIRPETLDVLHAPRTAIVTGEQARKAMEETPLLGRGVFYAQGWIHVYAFPHSVVWHNGGTTGCKSVVAFVPDAGIGIVVLSNLGGTTAPEILAQWFFDRYSGLPEKDWNTIVLKAYRKAREKEAAERPKRPAVPVPPLSREAYTGTYTNEVYGKVTVSEGKKNLELTMGPNRVKTILEHWDRDVFQWIMPDMPSEGMFARFSIDVSGKADTLTINILEASGEGVFQRQMK